MRTLPATIGIALLLLLVPTGQIDVLAQETEAAGRSVTIGPRPVPVSIHGYPALQVNQDSIVELLKEGRFSDLEQLFGALEEATVSDIRREIELDAAYRSFYGSDATIGDRLNEWVASDPGSDAALVARSQFHNARAWEARGEQLRVADGQGLQDARSAGFTDAWRAFQLDPDNLGAHASILRLFRSVGWTEDAEGQVQRSLTRFPHSYWLRHIAIGIMEPRWGGSYELMRSFAEDAQLHVDINPRLRVLLGAPLIEEASTLSMARRYDEALTKLEQARQFGTDWDFYYQRGRVLFHNNEPTSGVAVLDSAIAIRPVSEVTLEYRGWALYWAARRDAAPDDRVRYLDLSVADLVDAVKRSQSDEDLREILSDALAARGRCGESPADCFAARRDGSGSGVAGGGWWQIVVFIVSLPYTLYLVFVEGQKMHLLPMPLIAMGLGLWSFAEWRRQRFWTPLVVRILSVVGLATIIGINVAWVQAGGEMWTQRYVVIAIFGLFPFLAYLMFLGPKFIGRKRPNADLDS